MHLSRSTWRRLLVVLIASTAFVLVYGGVVRDSASELPAEERGQPRAGSRLEFEATAYCKGSMTATGTRVGRRVTGIAAADPDLLPLGSVVSITSSLPDYDGIYTVLDTGPLIQGRVVDLYMWSCFEALDFGRQPIEIRILRFGWDPTNTDPVTIDAAFREAEISARERGADRPLPRPEPEPATEVEAGAADDADAPAEAGPAAPPAVAATAAEDAQAPQAGGTVTGAAAPPPPAPPTAPAPAPAADPDPDPATAPLPYAD